MIKDNLELLDMDEDLREKLTIIHENRITFAKEHNLVVDLASSDVVIYLRDSQGNSICLG